MGKEITRSVSQSVTGRSTVSCHKRRKHFLPVGGYRIIYHGRNVFDARNSVKAIPVDAFQYQCILMKNMMTIWSTVGSCYVYYLQMRLVIFGSFLRAAIYSSRCLILYSKPQPAGYQAGYYNRPLHDNTLLSARDWQSFSAFSPSIVISEYCTAVAIATQVLRRKK